MNFTRLFKKLFVGAMMIVLLFVGTVSMAQIDVPESISDNCILDEQGFIDSCTSKRETLKDINMMLRQTRASQEDAASSLKDMQLAISKFSIQINTLKKKIIMAKAWTDENAFLIDYMLYITKLYQQELQTNISYKGAAEKLFQKTYFDQKQFGLSITSLELYKDAPVPSVYDESVTLQASVRNFDSDPITKVEDIYCFASQGGEDYIFPLQMQGEMFKANSITNIIGSLYMGDNEIMNIPGDKTLYCMIVYSLDGEEQRSDFASFDFLVE